MNTDRPDFQLTQPKPPDPALFDIEVATTDWPMPDTHPQPAAPEIPFVERVRQWINRGLV